MSIDKLKQRLEQQLSHSLAQEVVHTKFVKPQKLIKTLYVLEQRFDDFENAIPLDQKIFRTISKFHDTGFYSLSKRDWKNLAWALSKVLPDTENKLIFSDIGKKILQHFTQAKLDLIGLVYFPLLYSYFALENEDVKNKPETWLHLRSILSAHRSQVYRDAQRPKKWMNALIDYPELLSDLPTQIFVGRFLKDQDSNSIQQDLESLKIAPNSWFWDDLIHSSIQSIKKMSEAEFFQLIPRFLILSEKNTLYTTEILVALLERYAQSIQREVVHDALKHLALNQWGNPQYNSSAGWNNVNAETRYMVNQWFVRADLEAFFKVFSHGAETRRFNYWLRFIKQVSLSEIFLNDDAIYHATRQQEEFKNKNQGRYKRIIGKSTAANAFMIKIGGYYIVEFSELNNATYFYRKLPYKGANASLQLVNITDLKSTAKADFYLSHNGSWENSFDKRLKALGIYPD
ncbi:EH signature domain-containing protein [Acinetobacter sp. Marseille-Q1623]|uniref:EH signature domain-containing protein n=1 Tax=Acinetobacter sp. Marseille-Q1623 TaxID=2697501 RepID=UPI00157A46FF|nr:EH signature domain-containing protein [Acinetobacter sp. Marseille-Q1623]